MKETLNACFTRIEVISTRLVYIIFLVQRLQCDDIVQSWMHSRPMVGLGSIVGLLSRPADAKVCFRRKINPQQTLFPDLLFIAQNDFKAGCILNSIPELEAGNITQKLLSVRQFGQCLYKARTPRRFLKATPFLHAVGRHQAPDFATAQ